MAMGHESRMPYSKKMHKLFNKNIKKARPPEGPRKVRRKGPEGPPPGEHNFLNKVFGNRTPKDFLSSIVKPQTCYLKHKM